MCDTVFRDLPLCEAGGIQSEASSDVSLKLLKTKLEGTSSILYRTLKSFYLEKAKFDLFILAEVVSRTFSLIKATLASEITFGQQDPSCYPNH